MIVDAIINFCIVLFAGLLNIIPAMDFDVSGFTSVVTSLKGIIQPSAYFLPIQDIAIIVSLLLLYQASSFLIWSFNWVVRRIADIIP
ncbi:hypothetical protein FHS15_005795 [Paenibacillus castaneae]|uniref:hypothetical protein n=1 Tax=Paenibacillus castaneae TaxID=474957 RepID=UPI00141B8BED|nr:hypothetical protein [Paenibacillus castaneae]NIK80604.1 hypothetical protein [Paenibacillus castaneae]